MTDVELSEIDPQKIFLSDVITHKWSYKIKETGEICTKSYPYVRVYYENPNQPLSILIKNTNNGIQSSEQCPNLMFLSNSLTQEQSKMLQEKITHRISDLLFEVKKEFLKDGASI
jgi:hypothetical protein